MTAPLSDLYTADETAWLDAMAALIQSGRRGGLDYPHLAEFLTDMANRDRRAVKRRLTAFLTHVLKWDYGLKKRTRARKANVIRLRQRLADWAGGGVLRSHAAAVLPDVYRFAVKLVAVETGVPPTTFPTACPYTLDQLLTYSPAD